MRCKLPPRVSLFIQFFFTPWFFVFPTSPFFTWAPKFFLESLLFGLFNTCKLFLDPPPLLMTWWVTPLFFFYFFFFIFQMAYSFPWVPVFDDGFITPRVRIFLSLLRSHSPNNLPPPGSLAPGTYQIAVCSFLVSSPLFPKPNAPLSLVPPQVSILRIRFSLVGLFFLLLVPLFSGMFSPFIRTHGEQLILPFSLLTSP